jgi:uncharacterized RDD family membrane protein YckC
MSGDPYVQSVIDHIPAGLPLRDQVAMELRGHIAERMANGQPLDEILRQLGDPEKLAESYLAAIPLQAAGIGARLVAKIIDLVLVVTVVGIAIGVPMFVLSVQLFGWQEVLVSPDSQFDGPQSLVPFLPVVGIVLCVFGFAAYTVVAEYQRGATVGKQMMGVRVVQESGARITLGQALLRQLPFFMQFFFIDALFAVFTKHHQRAFELITKTRAVA